MKDWDPAFADRLGLKWRINAPGLQPIYEILRSSLRDMMLDGVIRNEEVPPYIFAKKMAFDGELSPGASLYFIAHHLLNLHQESAVSARILRQLPQHAWLCCLETSFPSLSRMLVILNMYVQRMPSSIINGNSVANEEIASWDDSHLTIGFTNNEKVDDACIDSTEVSHIAEENMAF